MLYWANDEIGSVYSMPAAGGTPKVLVSGQNTNFIAVDDQNVYWTDDTGRPLYEINGGAAHADGSFNYCAIRL